MRFNKNFNLLLLLMLALVSCASQIKNAKTVTFKVYGNCGMCKTTIEKAASIKDEAKAEWNKETKIASLTYDSVVTNADIILKRIADAGYDNEMFLATNTSYNNLHSCCQYERSPELSKLAINESHDTHIEHNTQTTNDNMHQQDTMHQSDEIVVAREDTSNVVKQTNTITFQTVLNDYISLKNAMVKSNASNAKQEAEKLLKHLEEIDMASMETKVHNQFMQEQAKLTKQAKSIASSNNLDKQRTFFTSLSVSMYAVIKVSKPSNTIYYQHCPMYNEGKGANWLSMEKEIKNPYYGTQMLNCGNVEEIIK